MKSIVAALIVAFVVIGCDKSGPVDSSTTYVQDEAMFSELSMAKTSGAVTVADGGPSDSIVCPHDSLRNQHMLDSLKAFLTLTDAQFDSVRVYGATLFATLEGIKAQIDAKTITRDSAQALVKAARDLFVVSVKNILTADQLTIFEKWLTNFWNRPPLRGIPGGRGHDGRGHGHGGPGGPGRPGGPGGPGRP